MNKRIYDLSLLTGTALCGGGAAALWGAGVACMVVGALLIALTLVGALIMGGKG